MADANYNFFKSLNCNVFDLKPKILDELHLALEHCENPIMQTMQVISELHGPFNGGSQALADFVNTFKGQLGKFESALQKSITSVESQINQIKQLTSEISSNVNLINQITSSQMDTPTLRAFVCESQKLNPLINDMIQREIGKFPMFQQISEQVGMFYNLHVDKRMVDPEKVLTDNTGYKKYDTNMVMRKQNFKQGFRPVTEMVEHSHNFTESLVSRCVPYYDLGNHVKGYSGGSPSAHGYTNCQDVFHLKRAQDAKNGAMIKLLSKFGDRLRLLNSFFPVTMSVNYGTESQEIQTEHGPVLVDEHGRNYGGFTDNANKDNLDALGSSEVKQSVKC
jgi:hypothetical protein